MAQERVQPIRRFQALDESGKPYHIVGSQRVLLPPGGGPVEPVSISLRTVEGFPVTRISKGVYDIEVKPLTGDKQTIRVRSAASDAP